MKVVAVSELKAKLAKFLRLVKAGEEVEIRERGVAVAVLKSLEGRSETLSIPPRTNPAHLAKMKFTTRPKIKFDAAQALTDERRKR